MNNWIHIAIWAVAIGVAFGIFWYLGHVRRFAAYVQETREELKKCSWPSWIELRGSTVLIAIVIILLGIFTVVVDFAFKQVFFNFFYNL